MDFIAVYVWNSYTVVFFEITEGGKWLGICRQGITTPMGVATYDNIGTKDIIDQMPTQEQINRQIDLAEAEFRKRN